MYGFVLRLGAVVRVKDQVRFQVWVLVRDQVRD